MSDQPYTLADVLVLIEKLTKQNAALREQLAKTWQPCVEDVDLQCIDQKTEIGTMYCGTGVYIDGGQVALMPPGYAICKLVTP